MKRDDIEEKDENVEDAEAEQECLDTAPSGKFDKVIQEGFKKYRLSGMYKEWFLDYASYVILERAVPHIEDGLKPVQRRILHAMKLHDDGRLNKVATLVGATMPFHPHGDASIKDALVQLGQKDLLIDCQGNWGNILTGDAAAAARYIEARLTPFAKEVVFNNKTTEWVNSYDGRNQEPVNLPVKFPLLLAQGSEGIAVGLACKILPHNFNELIDASIAYLRGEDFELYPDFVNGGLADVSAYNRGIRGGKIRVRANIVKVNKNTLAITEIPFGKTTSDIIDSILKANDKGKIRIKKIDDNTAEHAEIVITLSNDISPDKTIDALYAFTDCEVSISPNSCVIKDHRPCFMGVDEILKYNTDTTKALLQRELEIKLEELGRDWHYTSLEKIFFENRVYKILENNARSWEEQLGDVMTEMLKYQHMLRKPITDEDISKLVEKPVRKISRFDIKAVNDKIASIEAQEAEIRHNLERIVEYTIDWYNSLKAKYGDKYPRRTRLTSFENIEAAKVVVNNAKLYANKAEGFVGISAKKIDDAEYICDCSDIDEIIVFLKNGKYIISKVADKLFFDKNIMHVSVFNRADERTIYNVIYRDGRGGISYAKRFAIKGITRDKWYDLTQGTPDSAVLWFSANPNGEAESLKVYLRAKPKLKKLLIDFDFATLAIKNRNSLGNIVTKNSIHRISLKSSGISTIGAKQLYFDWDVNRLNEDGRGELIGDFFGGEHILVICKDGTYYTTNLDLSNRYQGDILKIEKLDESKIYSAVYWDGAVKCFYIKRFTFEVSDNTPQYIISEDKGSYLHLLSEDRYPQILLDFVAGERRQREPEYIDVDEFIAVKGFRAKGKRLSAYDIEKVQFVEPLEKEEPTSDGNAGDSGSGDSEPDNQSKDVEAVNGNDLQDKSQKYSSGTIVDLEIDPDPYDEPTLF